MSDGANDRWTVSIDKRDVIGAVGVALMLIGAAALHWGVAIIVAGVGLFWLAIRLADRRG